MRDIVIIVLGFIFGILISYARLNRYDTISGLAVLKDLTVAKTIMLVIGIGSILLALEMASGSSVFHLKPLFSFATGMGGLIFGMGMAILGYCPGTLPISLGQGSVDALIGIIGGLVAGWVFSVGYPWIQPLMGEDLGNISLFTWLGSSFNILYFGLTAFFGLVFIAGSVYLDRLDKRFNHIDGRKWILTAIGLVILNLFLFLSAGQNRPLGASTSYPYIADVITGNMGSSYFALTVSSGSWQMKFLLGAMLAGFVSAFLTGTFKVTLIHKRWLEYKGPNPLKRIIWAFIGGFLLIFGARLADGCTSGHIISGGMQFAASSYVFMVATFIGFLTTGYLFYTRNGYYSGKPGKN